MADSAVYVMISPNFPSNYENFVRCLNKKGIKVIGIGDAPHSSLGPVLDEHLTEYYFVADMHDYASVHQTAEDILAKYGRIDRLESHNEFWLELDAQLRTDFDIFGIKNDDIARITHKSRMKEVFRSAGVKVAQGDAFTSLDQARQLLEELSYPVIIKPDRGVGASNTWKIMTEENFQAFVQDYDPETVYMMEEYVPAEIVSYDGLTDKDGNIVFSSSFINSIPPLEILVQDTDMFYYVPREIDPRLEELGRATVEAFDIKERFFHIEYFKTQDGDYLGLELNCRPPGGVSLDMWDYANDLDIYAEYANIVADNQFTSEITRPYYACYVSRKNNFNYSHSHEEIINKYGDYIMSYSHLSDAIADIMGNTGYIVRSEDLETMMELVAYIGAKD